MPKPLSASLWLAPLAVTAYAFRFGASWLLLQRVPARRFDPHAFGLLGDAILLSALAIPVGVVVYWVLRHRGPWRGLLAPAASRGRTLLSVFLLLVLGAPTLNQIWTMILLPFSDCWPVVLSAALWFAVAAVLRALAATSVAPRPGSTPWGGTLAIGAMLSAACPPFVGLFPEPPAFGRGAAALVATFAVLATAGMSFRAPAPRRARIMRRAAMLLATTVAALVLRTVLSADVLRLPTPDVLPWLFGLQGEEVDDAVLYEAWLEIWLACGLAVLLLSRARPAGTTAPEPGLAVPPPLPWNVATRLLWSIGWVALAGAVLDGHWTAAFLATATHVPGEIADDEPHPLIRFTTVDGAPVSFRQNGFVSRPRGASIPVAYQAEDPAGTAQAETFWASWSGVLGLAWIGLGFTLHPFFGFRAAFRGGR